MVDNLKVLPPSETLASDTERRHKRPASAVIMKVPISILKKTVAELLGTFILVFSAVGGAIVDHKYKGSLGLIGNAACSGFAVLVIVISIGHISKAHLNPAVTLAFAARNHFPWAQVPGYILAELIGSISASFLMKAAYPTHISAAVNVPSVGIWQAIMLEFVASFVLMFVIMAVATDPTSARVMAGVGIGGAVFLDILVIGPATGGSMNPARTIGPALAAKMYHKIWIYMLAPPLGAFTGATIYEFIKLDQESQNHQLPQHVQDSNHH